MTQQFTILEDQWQRSQDALMFLVRLLARSAAREYLARHDSCRRSTSAEPGL